MAKQLNVDLNFRANTSQAQKSIMELQTALSKVAMGNNSLGIDPSKMKAASEAARELSIHLNNAFNAETGNFDLSKLDRSLKTSSTNVTELSSKLLNAGATGQNAFIKLAQTIAAADRPVVTLNSKLTGLMTTLKNTARWQLSSSILHGFMGSVQKAYGYAQDLNESLNNIRIVSGQNTEQMAEFAEQANKAAKNLSTTTTAYTKAALLFYQQGDRGSEIIEKSDVVTKMSNVTGQNTSTVSDQLTAIWNNFNKAGDKAYEHYADVLTALGAETASSTDEIAGGLEKFAGIAETVGLSYEYAASALATITATSRESEDVVGTALKTIFSRIQGLSLGETLDDGTTLNKYSEALMKVGISIKDQNGQIKQMDNILDEIGSKWKLLNEDQKMALAQTVAGTRQYNQLMTLMNNWDFMQKNVSVAKNSEGELQRQQEIYEESWQAANDRVRASMEAIYSDILDDQFFIDINNGFSAMLDSVDAFIDGAGGIKTIVIGIGSMFLSTVANKITPALQNLKHSFSVVFQSAEQQAKALSTEMNSSIVKILESEKRADFNTSSQVALKNAMQLNEAKAKMQSVENNLTAIEKQRYSQELNMIQLQQQETQEVADRITKLKQEKDAILDKIETSQLIGFGQENASQGKKEIDRNVDIYKQSMYNTVGDDGSDANINAAVNAYMRARDAAIQYQETQKVLIESTAQVDNAFRQMGDSLDLSNPTTQLNVLNTAIQESYSGALQDLGQRMKGNKSIIEENATSFVSFRNSIDLAVASMPEVVRESQQMQDALSNLYKAKDYDDLEKALDQVEQALKSSKLEAKDFSKVLQEINPQRYKDLETNAKSTNKALDELKEKQKIVNKTIEEFNPKHVVTGIERITQTAAGLGQVAMAAQSCRSIFSAWNDDDLSVGEKITTTLMSISMLVPSVIGALKSLNTVTAISNTSLMQAILWNKAYVASLQEESNAIFITRAAKQLEKTSDVEHITTLIAKTAVKKGLIAEEEKEAFTTALLTKLKNADSNSDKQKILSETLLQTVKNKGLKQYWQIVGASVATTGAKAGETSSLWANVVAWIATQAVVAPVLVTTLLIVAAITSLVLIVWGLVAAFKAIQAASPEGKLKAAKKEAEELSTALDEAKQAAEDLKSAFNDYDNAVKALEDCTKGTQEWRDALREVNNEVLGLLSEYPELATMTNDAGEKAITYGENGEMVVADWAKEELLNKANTAIVNTQTAATLGNQNVREAQIKVDKKDFANSLNKIYGTEGTSFDQDVSSNIANYISENATKLANMTQADQKAMLSSYFSEQGIIANAQGWVDAIAEMGPEFGKLTKAIEQNTAATKLENETIASSVLSSNEAIQESDYANQITKVVAEGLDKEVDAKIKALEDKGWGTDKINKATGVNAEVREIFRQYAEVAGINNYDLLDTTGTDKNRNFVYRDSSGQEVTVSLDAMKRVMASAQVNEELAKNANSLLETMNRVGETSAAAITAAVTKDVNNLTIGQLDKNYDIQAVADNLSAEELQQMGFESAEAFINAFNETVTNGKDSWYDIANDYSKSIEASLKDLKKSGALEEFTLSEADSLGGLLQQAFNKGGKEGLSTLESMLKDVGNESDEFAMILGGLDWNTITIEELIPLLEEAGIECDGLESALERLINLMSDGAMTLGKATEVYASLHKIIDDLEEGDTVTNEEYKTLLEMVGDDVNSYFMQMADGSHKLIGDAEDFYKLVNGFTLDNFDETVDKLNVQKNKIDTLISGGEESITGSSYTTNGRISLSDRRTNAFDNSQVSIDENKLQQQLDYLEAIGYDDENQMSEWRQGIEDKDLSIKDLSEINKAVENNIESWGKLSESQKQVDEDLKNTREAIASSATTIDELNVKLNEGRIEQEDFDKALKSVFKTQIEKEGLDIKQAEYYAKSAEAMGYTVEEAYKLAIVQTKLSRGFDSLSSNWKKWTDVMTDSNATIDEIAEIMPDINKSLSDIMNWDLSDVELLPADFVKSNWSVIQDIYNGVDGAIEKLTGLAAKSFIVNLDIDTSEVQNEYQAIMSWLDNMPDYEIGMTLDSTEMTDAFNALLEAGLITVDQMNDILSKIGFTPEIKYKDVEITDSHTQSIASNGGFTRLDENGNEEWVPISNESEVSAYIGTSMRIPYIDGKDTIYSGGGGVEIEAPKDRTGGKSKKPKRTHQSETVERYKEVTDKIDDTADAMEDARRAADGLWGPSRIKKMREVQNEMKKEIGLLREKKAEAERYLAQDQANLQAEANRLGIGAQFSFDSNGNIANYTAIMNQLHEQLRAAESAAGSDPTETQQKALDDIEYKINEIKKIIGIYDETRETLEDIDNEIEDKILELQQEKFDEINLELEVDLVVNETQLKELEYYLSKVEDDFFGMAEAIALMVGQNENGFNQLGVYMDSLTDYQEQYNRLTESYTTIDPSTGRTLINQAQFIEGLQDVQDGLYENLGNLQELNKEMIHYYGDTLAAAAEELEKYTSLMDHHTDTLDHYSTLLNLLGKSKDFERMKTVLSAQVEVSENSAAVSKANYEMLAKEAEEKKKILDETTYDKDSYEYSVIQQEWLDAQNAANEAQDQMLSDAEAWAESLKELLETELAELADILNKSLSAEFGTLDNMITQLNRTNSLQEEYLTTTNKIYETNKLMRSAQQEIDKTTNSVAKRRMKQFINETNQLQNQNKLSQFELDIQQAKYDLLLAEIALEEAQQAKSTVRLQRDAEGNFGYVYTADQNEITNAQQELEDAQNALYNIALDGANKYTESYIQTLQEMNDAITELTESWYNGEIASKEEYHAKMEALEKYYNEKLMQYSSLRTIALSADSRVMSESWTRDFAHMTTQTERWMESVDRYISDVEGAMGRYEKEVDRIEGEVGLDLVSLKEKTNDITKENKALAQTIQNTLIPKMAEEIKQVSLLTGEYIKLHQEINATIKASEALARSIGQTIRKESDDNSASNSQSNGINSGANNSGSGSQGVKGFSPGGQINAGTAMIHDYAGSPGERQYYRNDPVYTILSEQGEWVQVRHHSLSSGVTGWFKKSQVAALETGGYTGDWTGSYGKLAFLHQKEIVLNAKDTENLLMSIELLNHILEAIDLQSANAQIGGLLSSPGFNQGGTQTVEQQVHIEASFPNVQDRNEIEEAFNNLINKASQYANRK